MKSRCDATTSWLPRRPARSGELRLAGPLEDREPDRKERDAGENRQCGEADAQENLGDRAVECVAAHHVAHLVCQQHPELVVIQHLEGGGVDHGERVVDAVGPRVEDGRLGHVQLRYPRPVESAGDFRLQSPEFGELGGACADRVALEEQANAALAAEEPDHLAHYIIESGDGAQRLERCPVGRMLPGNGGDLGKPLAGPSGGDGRHGRLTAGGCPNLRFACLVASTCTTAF